MVEHKEDNAKKNAPSGSITPESVVPGSVIPKSEEPERLDSAIVATLYIEHSDQLRRFLYGILRESASVADVLQSTFVKMTEVGHKTKEESRKAWLFRVAYHEALALKRRSKIKKKVEERLSWIKETSTPGADIPTVHWETVQQVQQAIGQLPEELQQIVRKRIYEEKTFAVISEELDIPLGTALGRMRNALTKLRGKLDQVNKDIQK
ncbi:MAG: RNA polymerase subunit sigma-70 [Blastopirellula sp.]|nr:MAG: RNA polymerase subunit sigma-70 [Blastopirellula sp.]